MGAFQSQKTATIANGETVSDSVYCGDKVAMSLQIPAAITGTAISFQGSHDGVTYLAVNSGGSAYSETVAASKSVDLDSSKLQGYRHIKLVSNGAEGAERSIGVTCRKLD